jgi:hypothetical protein
VNGMAIWVGHQLVHAVETDTGYRIELGDRILAEGPTKEEALDNAAEVLRAEGTLFKEGAQE